MDGQPTRRGITGPDVLVPLHPAAPPAIAMTVLVSVADQQWIDEVRHRSYLLAFERGHLRR